MYIRLSLISLIFGLGISLNAQKSTKSKNPLNFSTQDLASYGELIIYSRDTDGDVLHEYYRQSRNQIPIWGTIASIHKMDSKIYKKNSSNLLAGIKDFRIVNTKVLDAISAVIQLSQQLSTIEGEDLDIETIEDTNDSPWTKFEAKQIANDFIGVEEVLYRSARNALSHAFAIAIDVKGGNGWQLYIVDAQSASILHEEDWTVSCSHDREEHNHDLDVEHSTSSSVMFADSFQYNVFQLPIESPYYGSRSLESSPWDTIPSPNGWHEIGATSYTVTKGNNVDTYLDANGSNSATNGDDDRAEGGDSLVFDFPWANNGMHTTHEDAALTNIFYISNIIHDILHYYGFDEEGGNFQEENYTVYGSEDDYIKAEVQDQRDLPANGSNRCNANFGTPPDGFKPRMQTYICSSRDLAMDNAITAHEIAHGLSNRLVGGRFSTSCLFNQEQMGEGWSDWLGYVLTIEPGDTGTDARGIGNWLTGAGAGGSGIRNKKYSTDFAVNNFTYKDIKSQSVPHGVGSVWATMLWDLTWNFIDLYGYDANLNTNTATSGNQKIIELVIMGLKMTSCRPGFVDGRDAILAADSVLYGGIHNDLIWETFARRGLGYSADQGRPTSNFDGTEAFDLPPDRALILNKTVDTTFASEGDILWYEISAINNTASVLNTLMIGDRIPQYTSVQTINNGGVVVGDSILWQNLGLSSGDTLSVSFSVVVEEVKNVGPSDLYDDGENLSASPFINISFGSTSWVQTNSESNSGSSSWFANDASYLGEAYLTINQEIAISADSKLSFVHWYNTESNWDGGIVQLSIDGGEKWVDLKDHFIRNGYNSLIHNQEQGFSGNSGGFITSVVDLSPYGNQQALIRFVMNCDVAVGGNGWYIDDISIDHINQHLIPNKAVAKDSNLIVFASIPFPTLIDKDEEEIEVLVVEGDIVCAGDSNANIGFEVSHEISPPNYLWSTGETTQSISNLGPGLYTGTVTSGEDTFFIVRHLFDPPALQIESTSLNSSSGNGMASATATGGEANYSYLWSNGVEAPVIENLIPGEYYVTATDSRGCIRMDTVEVLSSSCDSAQLEVIIDFDEFPGENKYMFLLAGDTIFDSGYFTGATPNSRYIANHCLETDCYDFVILDQVGDGICVPNSSNGQFALFDVKKNFLLIDSCFTGSSDTTSLCVDDLTLDITSTPMSCDGTPDGAASAIPSGGSGTYTYLWSHGPNTANVFSLGAGIYTVSVSDGVNVIVDSIEIFELGYPMVKNRMDSGEGSLRELVFDACDGDTIRFAPTLSGLPIVLTSGQILIDKNIVLQGLGQSQTLISGSNNDNVFVVSSGNTVTLMDLVLSNGEDSTSGGAIVNLGNLTLVNTNIQYSYQNNDKVPLVNMGTLTIMGGSTMKY